ncbi:MAG TPA: PIN domain-containing protein [Candidatus Binatia bacterium]|nr:PIN domain-containing protein [Candidatus Binatia bacterium]
MGSRPLHEVPDGTPIFVDTNILIYHLLDDELYGLSCRDFLTRVEDRVVTAFTSPIVISDTLFIYLRSWIIKNKQIAPKQVLRYLKRHRAVIQEVDFQKPRALLSLLRVLPLNRAVLRTSYDMMARYHLLPADATNAALLQRHRLPALATRDDDFDHVEDVEVFKPITV